LQTKLPFRSFSGFHPETRQDLLSPASNVISQLKTIAKSKPRFNRRNCFRRQ